MADTARAMPQRIKVSSKRQITIPAKAYKDMGFTDYALIEQTDEGLLIKPLKVEDEGVSLDVLRRLITEGYAGEELVERYAALCPHVVRFSDLRDSAPASIPAPQEVTSDESREGERERVLAAVAQECGKYEAKPCVCVFGSFARGDFAAESDVDVRLEYDKAAPFSLFEVAQFQKHVERVTGRDVDVVTARKVKNPNLAAAIEREKVLVYERKGH